MFKKKFMILAAGALMASASMFATPSISAPAGTLLNSMTASNVSIKNALNKVTSTVDTSVAVYQDAGTGNLDFYYQVKDVSGRGLSQFSASDFTGYVTSSYYVNTLPTGSGSLFRM